MCCKTPSLRRESTIIEAEPVDLACSLVIVACLPAFLAVQSTAGSSHYLKLTAVTLRGERHSLDCAQESCVPILCAVEAIIMTLGRVRLTVADPRGRASCPL